LFGAWFTRVGQRENRNEVVKGEDPSGGGHQALVGGLADFVSEFLE